MKKLLACALTFAISANAWSDSRSAAEFGDVTLQGPLGDRLERMVRNHVAAKDPVYLAECFRSRSEVSLWQTEFWGKYMHGACPLWALTKCPALKAKIDASVGAVIAAQDDEGYIGNYSPERRYKRGTWDVWGSKYVMMGLLHYYDMTKDEKSLAAALKLCRYVAKKVGPGAKPSISATGNHAGMASCSILEPVVWLYNRTKEKDVLAFADFIVKEMSDTGLAPRLVDLAANGVPVAERAELPDGAWSLWRGEGINRGKAYEMMSCYQGLLEYYEATGRKDLLNAALATATNIAEDEINLAGGAATDEHWYHGAKHQHEPFSRMQETCVTITWMRLCEKLLALTGDVRWADRFEQTFYNAYLGSLDRDGSEFAAYTPMSGSRSSGHLHCRMHTNCCNENGPRGFVSFLRSMVQAKGDDVYLNYYASSRAKIRIPATGETAEFEIHTLYPKEGHVDIFVRTAKPTKFKFSVRIPGWAAGVKMLVNKANIEAKYLTPGRWVMHEREWRDGDRFQLDFELPVKMHRLEDSVAFTRGPVLLARDTRFADGDLSEALRKEVVRRDFTGTFSPVRSPDPSMWMAFEAELPFGTHGENPNGRLPASVRFCDYASAANAWRPENVCRTWFKVESDLSDTMKPQREKASAPRFDRSKLLIGTYCMKPEFQDEAHVKDLADCGIDFLIAHVKPSALDLFAKHKVGVVQGGVVPGWWGGANRNGKMAELNPLGGYVAAMERFRDHPAIVGIDIGDEPSALDFEHYGKVAACVARYAPEKLVYINLFPNYAAAASLTKSEADSQLGTPDYRTYIEKYCRCYPLDYICFDSYIWGWGNTPSVLFENMRIVSDACAGAGKSPWVVLQVNSYKPKDGPMQGPMTENRLRYQANVSLAFGAELISWACWTKGWWEDNVLDTNGVKTAQYERLKTVNAELHRLGPEFMRFRRLTTDLVGFDNGPDGLKGVGQAAVASSEGAVFRGVKATDSTPIAVGQMIARDGSNARAIFIASCDDPHDRGGKLHTVAFRVSDMKVRAVDGTGAVKVTKNADGSYSVPVRSSGGVLVIAEP